MIIIILIYLRMKYVIFIGKKIKMKLTKNMITLANN